jgi:hypothetical protein
MPLVGVLLAVFAAVANSGATLLEAAAADGFARARWASTPLYLLGLVLDLMGWLLTLAALHFLPIFAVQSIVAEQIAITVLVGGQLVHSPTRSRDLTAAAATVVGLGVLAASGAGAPTGQPVAGLVPILAGMVGLGALLSWAFYRRRAWLGATVLAGTCFSATAVLARGTHVQLASAQDVVAAARTLDVWLMVAFGVAGTLVYVWALSRATAGAVLAVLSVTEVVLPGTTGLLLLGDAVRPGWALPCALGLALALCGAAILSLSSTRSRHLVAWAGGLISGSVPVTTTPPGPGTTGTVQPALDRSPPGPAPPIEPLDADGPTGDRPATG